VEDCSACSILALTPSLLRTIPKAAEHDSIRSIFLGGEPPDTNLVEQWSSDARKIYNSYGSTETTCTSMISELEFDRPITLGSPIPGSIVFIVQEDLTEAVEGELMIGGQGLAAGYVGDTEQTKHAFFDYKGTRVYRTGDYVKRTTEGLMYIGRRDSVVKNRGARISLETQVIPGLRSYPSVLDATAFMHKDCLVAFVTPASLQCIEIRTWLSQRCDSYTVPDQIFAINHFPLTTNGKINLSPLRQSLDDSLNSTGHHLSGGIRYETGEHLNLAICDVLKIPIADLDLNRTFWDHGGNSMNAIKLLSYLRRNDIAIPFQELLSSTIISDLHSKIEQPPTITDQPTESDSSDGTIAATFQQLSMLQSTLLHPSSAHIVVRFDFSSQFDISKEHHLRDAWREVLSMHPIFASVVDLRKGTQSTGEMAFNWTRVVLSDQDNFDRTVEEFIESFVADEIIQLRSAMYQPTNDMYFIANSIGNFSLIWPVHHAFIDGWSIGTILADLDAELCGRTLDPPQTLTKYGNSVEKYIAETRPASYEFWKSFLHNIPVLPSLKTICPLSTIRDKFRSSHTIDLGMSRKDLVRRSRELGVSDSTIIYSSWGMVLQQYTSSSQVVFGTVHSGRTLPVLDIDRIVAPMINTCPLPLSFEDHTPVTEMLKDLFIRHAAIADHQWGVAGILSDIWPASLNTLFDTIVAIEYGLPVSARSNKIGPFECKISKEDYPEFKFTLFVEVDNYDNLVAKAVYDPRILQFSLVERMLSCFKAIVSEFRKDDLDCCTVGDICRPASESATLMRQMRLLSGNQPSLPVDVVTMFKYASEACSNMSALEVYGGESMPYSQLASRSDIVAHNLLLKVKIGDIVAVLSDGSIDWVIAMLGVLKAGATYAPIDVSLPTYKIINYLERSNAKQCINIRENHQLKDLGAAFPFASLNSLLEHPCGSSKSQPANRVNFDLPAYLIFTSGSTGNPKPVRCTHGGIAWYLSNPTTRLFARPGRRHAQMYSVGFDVSIAEVLGTICFGATLVLKNRNDPYVHLSTVHAAMLTPSFLSSWAPESLGTVDTLLLAGEPVTQMLADRWSGRVQLYNGYGPCEGTIISTIKKLLPGQRVTIGSPVPGMIVHILDENKRLVPTGVAGEICISGIQVATGYLNTESSSVAFGTDPFFPERRMYCTGDFGAWTEDMEVVFFGRKDNQVKVRGYRVEIEEVEEALLSSTHGILQAGVFLNSDAQNLVAAVAPRTVGITDIQSHLEKVLPPHAIPSRILAMDALPLNANQKLDRASLMELCTIELDNMADGLDVESQTATEISISQIWIDILGLPSNTVIRSTDHFQDRGGHSLRQLRLSQCLSQQFNVPVPLPVVLKNPIMGQLVIAVDKIRPDQPEKLLKEPLWVNYVGDGSLSPLEEQIFIYHDHSALRSALNLGVRVRYTVDTHIPLLERAINYVLGSHEIFRSRYQFKQAKNVYWRSLHSSSPQVNIPSTLSINDPNLMVDITRPLDLFDDMLVEAKLSSNDSGTTLHLIMHHIITDEDSISIIIDGIGEVYNNLIKHALNPSNPYESSSLPQYAQWASWIRSNSTYDRHSMEDFWKEKFPQLPKLPFSKDGSIYGEAGDFSTMHVGFRHTTPLSQAHIIAAVSFSIASVADVPDVTIGVSHLDRSMPGTQSLVGLFLDRLPVPISVDAHANLIPTALVDVAEKQLNSCLDHIIPYRNIQQAISADTRELFDVMVSFHREDTSPTKTVRDGEKSILVDYSFFRDNKAALFPLLVDVSEVDDGLRFDLLYKPRLVSQTCIASIKKSITEFLVLLDTSNGDLATK
jgi:amino acid adenylation domain-containing protein